ncbi:hypothetical protein SLA2020_012480 [Shorea laevis]
MTARRLRCRRIPSLEFESFAIFTVWWSLDIGLPYLYCFISGLQLCQARMVLASLFLRKAKALVWDLLISLVVLLVWSSILAQLV